MKRDMDLARKIMVEIEKLSYSQILNPTDISGHSQEEISYHIMLLDEAGLVHGINQSGVSDLYWMADRLTWNGHEFLEAAKDNTRWEKAKTIVEKSGGMVVEVLKTVLVKLVTDAALRGLGAQ